ncbi:hypothetical protein FRC03_001226 [Tulasnella sp. 419]|nr:hypothetical protein FRC03_001226 [Tulasnella sp. 419]
MGNANIDFSSFQFFRDQNTYSADDKHGSSNGQGSSSGTGGTKNQETVNLGKQWIELHANSANTYGKPVSLKGFGIVGKDSQNYYQPFNSTEVGADTDQAVGINGITQYQWGQTGLESQSGSVIDESNDYHKPDGSDSSNGYSPDDGYAVYSEQAKQVLQSAANQQNQKSGQA